MPENAEVFLGIEDSPSASLAQGGPNAPPTAASGARPAGAESNTDYTQNLRELPDERLLRAVLLDKAVAGATGSLLAWGAINLGAWFIFREDMMSTFGKMSAPPGTFDTLMYGGAVIGVCMLIFGIIGTVTRTPITGWLDSLSMFVVGGWNIVHDFLLSDAVKPYGYKVEPSTLFIVLGCAQIGWGGKQLFRFVSLGARPAGIDPAEKKAAREKLVQLLKSPASAISGRLKFSISTQTFPFFTQKTEAFTMWLLPDKAYCLEVGLNRVLEFERKPVLGRQFTTARVSLEDSQGFTREVTFELSSLPAFNRWASGA
jgi:hypothetical protein